MYLDIMLTIFLTCQKKSPDILHIMEQMFEKAGDLEEHNILLGMLNKSREKEEFYLFSDPDHYSIQANNKR